MSLKFKVDPDGRYRAALLIHGRKFKMSNAAIVNQLLLDVAERSFDTAPRADADEIRAELRQVVADRKFAGQMTSGGTARIAQTKAEGLAGRTTKKGKFIRHRSNRQLMAIHLIVNSIRGKGKGLYGEAMMKYSGKVSGSRSGGSGSLKIAFLPAIRAIMPKAKFKFSWSTKAKGIKRWPGSSGWGGATPAQPSVNPVGEFRVHYKSKQKDASKRADPILAMIMANAVAWKRSRAIERAEKIKAGDVAEFNRAR